MKTVVIDDNADRRARVPAGVLKYDKIAEWLQARAKPGASDGNHVVVVHGSNTDVDEKPAARSKWQTRLVDLAVTTCERGGVFILASGGSDPRANLDELRTALTGAGFHEREHFIFLLAVPVHEVVRWVDVQAAKGVLRLEEIVAPQFLPPDDAGTDVLPALAILCEGYLAVQAVHAPATAAGSGPAAKALQAMKWNEFAADPETAACRAHIAGDLKAKLGQVTAPDYWYSIAPSQAVLLDAVDREWGAQQAAERDVVRRFLDSVSTTIVPDDVGSAFLALCKRLGWQNV